MPGFGRLGSWRLYLPSTRCVASQAKQWMGGHGCSLAAGAAWRSSAVGAGLEYDLFASPGGKGKATFRQPPMLLLVNGSVGCISPKTSSREGFLLLEQRSLPNKWYKRLVF